MYLKALFLLLLLSFSFVRIIAQGSSPLPKVDKKFSVVAHIVEDSLGNPNITEANILNSFVALNNNFAKIGMSFEICEFRRIKNYVYDSIAFNYEINQLKLRNNLRGRINMYFMIADQDKESSICGLARFNGINNPGAIYILKNCLGNNTISHEMGHFFGLNHTFVDFSNQLADGTNCATTGDGICDTPADPYDTKREISEYLKDCRFTFLEKDGNGDFYDPLVSNIMSYYGCSCDFTDGQYRLMVKNYLNSIPNNW